MREITAQSKRIEEFIGNNEFYIPIYQRSYSWKTENVEMLLNDININDEGYFIGNILLEDNIKEEKLYVVDGQQRLTTIYIIILAIYKKARQLSIASDKNSKLMSTIDRFYNGIEEMLGLYYYDDIYQIEHDEHLKLHLLKTDQILLNQCVTFVQNDEKDAQLRNSNRLFMKAFITAYDFLTEIMQSNENSEKDQFKILTTFMAKVKNAIILPIQLSDLSDVFAVFSSMNSKGQPLTTIDLLKADILSYSRDNDDSLINKWEELINILKMGASELKLTEANRFLQNTYDAFYSTTNSSITVKQSLTEYRHILEENSDDITQFVEELQHIAKIYSLIASEDKLKTDIEKYNHPILNSLAFLQKLDVKSAYPILLKLFDWISAGIVSADKCCCLTDLLGRFYVRRNIVKRPKASNLRSKFLGWLHEADKEKDSEKVDYILKKLHTFAKSELDDETFIKSLNKPLYENDAKLTRLLLVSLERDAMRRGESKVFNKQNPDSLEDMVSKNQPRWTIEHIFPQDNKLSNSWREVIDEQDDVKAAELHANYKDKLGNLTLTGYNSEMSNHSFVDKRDQKDPKTKEYVGLRTGLYLNQTIFENESIDDKTTWTLEDIDRRTNQLSQRLATIFTIDELQE